MYSVTLECELHIQYGLRSTDSEGGTFANLSTSRILKTRVVSKVGNPLIFKKDPAS